MLDLERADQRSNGVPQYSRLPLQLLGGNPALRSWLLGLLATMVKLLRLLVHRLVS